MRIKKHVGENIVKADANFTKNITGFAIGGIPLCGHRTHIELTYIDKDLMSLDEVWAAAGTPNSVFCLKSKDLVAMTSGKIISISDLQ